MFWLHVQTNVLSLFHAFQSS